MKLLQLRSNKISVRPFEGHGVFLKAKFGGGSEENDH
jgi:hypothetical protein